MLALSRGSEVPRPASLSVDPPAAGTRIVDGALAAMRRHRTSWPRDLGCTPAARSIARLLGRKDPLAAPSLDPVPRFSKPRAFALLFTAIASVGMGQSMLFAVLAPLGREVGMSEIQIGAIISGSSLSFFFFSNIWGRLSDRLGRRRVILIGLCGYTIGTVGFASSFSAALAGVLAPTSAFVLLTAVRMVQSSVMSATPPAASAFIADITDVSDRARGMSVIGAAQNVGTIAGPAIGGTLALISLLTPIWLGAVLTLVTAVLIYATLSEPPKRVAPRVTGRLRFTDRRVVPFVVVGVSMFVGFAIVQQTLAFRIQDVLGLSPAETAGVFGIALMASGAASLLAQVTIVQWLGVPPMRLLRIATPILMTAFGVIAFGRDELSLVAGMTTLGSGMGLAVPGFTAGASLAVGAEDQGAVAGVTSSCPPLGFTIGPLLGSALYGIDAQLPYLTALAIYVPLALFVFVFLRPEDPGTPSAPLSGDASSPIT